MQLLSYSLRQARPPHMHCIFMHGSLGIILQQIRAQKVRTAVIQSSTDAFSSAITTAGKTEAAAGAISEVKPEPPLDPQPRHPFALPELPQHWDPMPEGAEVHEVVIYDNFDGAVDTTDAIVCRAALDMLQPCHPQCDLRHV